MKFRRLSLDAFGPFTGTTLDLSCTTGPGLHLIYGPNEAGKSSALRAIRDLLFGMPQHSPDAHLHPAPALRLSAIIERDGEELSFVRRKKRKDSLTTFDDQPLEEARLARFLNGLDAASFDRLFGLDDERLKEGGEQMLGGQGDVGEALFDAGASGRSVHRVRLALCEEADELYKDRGQKPELNRLLAVYAEQKKRAKDSVHLPEKYEEQQEGVRDKRREAEARRSELSRLRGEKEHVMRLRNVLSRVLERDRKSAERVLLGELPSLRRDVGDVRERLLAAQAEVERDAARLAQKLSEEQARLAALPAPSPILGMPKETVRSLGTLIGRAEKDIADLPKLRVSARTLREAIQARLPRLGLGAQLESVLLRRLPVAEEAQVRELGREFQGLSLKLESAERELPEAEAKVETLTNVIAQSKAARRIAEDALLPVELLERFEGELGQAEQRVEELSEKLAENAQARAALAQQLELLKGEHGVPSAALLAAARADREARLREAQELAADPKRKALELCLPLAALLQATLKADIVVDRLRGDAKRVAEAESLEDQLARSERERQRLEEALSNRQQELLQVNLRWQRMAERLGSAELLPREAARLLQEEREAWKELSRSEKELFAARAALSAVLGRAETAKRAMAAWRDEWQAALAPLGLPRETRAEQALALLDELGTLASEHEKLGVAERRLLGVERDIQAFSEPVRVQVQAFAPELAPLSPPEAATRLLELHRAASNVAQQRSGIEAEIGRARRELHEVEARRADVGQALGELCREAGVADVSALAELEQRVGRARALDAELQQLDLHLAEVSEGENLAVLIDEARQSDKGAVAARLLELEDAIASKEEQCRDLDRDVRELELGLRAYEGRAGADAAQELSATVARLAELSSSWVRRRLAATVLERVVEQYRERHQGPVLSRAGELFSRLTLGRFSRLRVGLEETRLECVEAADGKGLEVEQLSRGTRSELFLALKLASLEQYLRTAPPLPLVLDDVLVEWDDERSRVALQVLAEFSEHLQILLFTHHGRDVAAAEALGDRRIFTHYLRGRGPENHELEVGGPENHELEVGGPENHELEVGGSEDHERAPRGEGEADKGTPRETQASTERG